LIVFWILDAYFLRLEKLYGVLYDRLVENRPICDDCLLEMNREKLERDLEEKSKFNPDNVFENSLAFYVFLLVVIVIYIAVYVELCPYSDLDLIMT
jgi:hypothetical protein